MCRHLLQAIKEDKGVLGRGRDIATIAVASLGEIGGEQAAFALTEIWNTPELSSGCKEQTLVALGMVGDPASLEIFETVLRGKEDILKMVS